LLIQVLVSCVIVEVVVVMIAWNNVSLASPTSMMFDLASAKG
jgi:hypothetical protein